MLVDQVLHFVISQRLWSRSQLVNEFQECPLVGWRRRETFNQLIGTFPKAGRAQIGERVGLGIITATGVRRDPTNLPSKLWIERAPGSVQVIEFQHRRGGARQRSCEG